MLGGDGGAGATEQRLLYAGPGAGRDTQAGAARPLALSFSSLPRTPHERCVESPVPPSRDRPALPAAQVKLAYYRLAKETHPDVIGGGPLPRHLSDTPRHFRDTSDTPLRGNAPETTPAGRFEGSGGGVGLWSADGQPLLLIDHAVW